MNKLFSQLYREWVYGSNYPLMTRDTYRRELIAAFTMSAPVLLLEGAVLSKIAQVLYQASEWQQVLITGAPLFAMLTSAWWTQLARGRSKARLFFWVMLCVMCCVVLIGLIPHDAAWSWVLVGLLILGRCLIAGMLTLRSNIWRLNYPRKVRARITGRLELIATLNFIIVSMLVGRLLDKEPSLMVFIFIGGAVIGSLALPALFGLRVRGEKKMIREEQMLSGTPKGVGIKEMIQVLVNDQRYAKYMLFQYLAGVSNMIATITAVLFINQVTREGHLKGWIENEIFMAAVLATVLPQVLLLTSLPFWARLLDRLHVLRFRVIQGPFWVIWQVVFMVGVFVISSDDGELMWRWGIGFMAFSMICRGLAFGAGKLAWNLGHNDFSKTADNSIYMSIHLTLTGTRGVVSLLLAGLMFAGWKSREVLGLTLPGFEGFNAWTFAITASCAAMATIGFYTMARQDDQIREDA